MVDGVLPPLDKDVTNNWDLIWDEEGLGGNSNVVQNIEVFLQSLNAMFTGLNELSEEPRPIEQANGTAMTHTLFAFVSVKKAN